MNFTDTGVLLRNSRFKESAGAALFGFFSANDRFLDYAGGYGIYTRMMRDVGFDYYWDDPYTENVMARGFEYKPGADSIAALTAFEVFEHLADPCAEIKKMQEISRNIFFSTVLLPEPCPAPADWWYYALEHGQHISFYTRKSLEALASKFGRVFVSNQCDLHAFIDANLIPTRIMARWLWEWFGSQSKDTVKAVRSAYRFVPRALQDHGLKHRLKNLYRRWRSPGVFEISNDLSPSLAATLRATSLARDYAQHLLSAGSVYWSEISSQLKSRTVDDMYLLRNRLVQHQRLEARV